MLNPLVLVLNCGSSSVKFAIIDPVHEKKYLSGVVECIGLISAKMSYQIEGCKTVVDLNHVTYDQALNAVFDFIQKEKEYMHRLKAVGHRVVHGGEFFQSSVKVDSEVLKKIEQCSSLAPLHNPANLLGIKKAQSVFESLPQVVVFDTAFHQTMPKKAYLYAVPYEYYEKYQVRRYGFHGVSHQYVAQKAAQVLNKPFDNLYLITAHLGNGCSISAISKGKSVDTSMGLTPLEGLVMGTRSGDVDPALHLYLSQRLQLSLEEITAIYNKKSGILGLSGTSMDLRRVEEKASEGDEKAILSLEIMAYRLVKYIGAYAAVLGQLDALIFTGGIGENSNVVRANVMKQLTALNFALDEKQNDCHGRDNQGIITTPNSTPAIVLHTNEELMIAQDTMNVLQGEC
jgi:acetate kinase